MFLIRRLEGCTCFMFMKVLKTLILFWVALLPMKISALGVWDGTSEIWTKGDGTEKILIKLRHRNNWHLLQKW